jgi:RnfABCDGE-type electron transport complex B subunit
MNDITIAVIILSGLGLIFGLVLSTANRFFRVEEDPGIDIIEKMLPGSNCGACGQPGCRAFAESVLQKKSSPSGCTGCSAEAVERIADYLGVDAGVLEKRVARLLCAGGKNTAASIAFYRGLQTCSSAAVVSGGGKLCPFGCLGLGDCIAACQFGAISFTSDNLPQVDIERCTACGKCVSACPRKLFEIMPLNWKLLVQCRTVLKEDSATALCSAACTGCGLCAADAPEGLICMKNNLPRIDYDRNDETCVGIIRRCPTGAICWLDGKQFVSGNDVLPLGNVELIQYTEE